MPEIQRFFVSFSGFSDKKILVLKWLHQISKNVLFSLDTNVRVGFSFISWKPLTGEKIYLFAAPSLASYKFFCNSKKECKLHFEKIGTRDNSDLLHETFLESQDGNIFSSSGYCPLKLVCSYVWIKK